MEVSRHMKIHNTLRTVILVRQEEVAGTEFGRQVIKIMRTKYRASQDEGEATENCDDDAHDNDVDTRQSVNEGTDSK